MCGCDLFFQLCLLFDVFHTAGYFFKFDTCSLLYSMLIILFSNFMCNTNCFYVILFGFCVLVITDIKR